MAGEAMDICLWVLKESNKSRFDSYSVRNSVLRISHITFRDCRMHIFLDNLSQNSCMGSGIWKPRISRGILNRVPLSLRGEFATHFQKIKQTYPFVYNILFYFTLYHFVVQINMTIFNLTLKCFAEGCTLNTK